MKNTKELVLAKIKETLLQVAPGAKVILFGSRARNDARSDSDWDILILVDKNKLDPDDFDRISYPLYVGYIFILPCISMQPVFPVHYRFSSMLRELYLFLLCTVQ